MPLPITNPEMVEDIQNRVCPWCKVKLNGNEEFIVYGCGHHRPGNLICPRCAEKTR
jgi:hypothetical protein